jgi:glycosyltransferase involved in cell wall biosynthesis
LSTRIVFFVEPEWAYGVIHYDLTKWLQQYDVKASVMAWTKQYTLDEVQELSQHIDYFVSTPSGLEALCIYHYKIKPEQCIAVCHSREDIVYLQRLPVDVQNRIARFGAVSNWVRDEMVSMGITKPIQVCTLGIDYEQFYSPVAKELEIVGYAGAYKIAHNDHIKRAHLVDQAVGRSGLGLKIAMHYHNSFVTMPGFYPQVGAVVISSTHEGAGLPALEAAAAGRLVISTAVGHWDRIGIKGAVEMPIDAEQFVEGCTETLTYYKNNPKEYQIRCLTIQEHAREYDWKHHVESWVKLIK